ncbi:hypothetical protein GCM10009760_59660 [Kitasatospora kazusensis]|uniref:Uncharacterized protein n=1 Tax=Kitasatospora kazusensis TaxID=407974 RepID=A0ABP5M414_9ACTN
MLLVHLALAGPPGAPGTRDEAAALQDALWAHAAPHHALEHVRVQCAPHGLGVALFIRTSSDTAARRQASDLLAHVLGTVPGACRYSVIAGPAVST